MKSLTRYRDCSFCALCVGLAIDSVAHIMDEIHLHNLGVKELYRDTLPSAYDYSSYALSFILSVLSFIIFACRNANTGKLTLFIIKILIGMDWLWLIFTLRSQIIAGRCLANGSDNIVSSRFVSCKDDQDFISNARELLYYLFLSSIPRFWSWCFCFHYFIFSSGSTLSIKRRHHNKPYPIKFAPTLSRRPQSPTKNPGRRLELYLGSCDHFQDKINDLSAHSGYKLRIIQEIDDKLELASYLLSVSQSASLNLGNEESTRATYVLEFFIESIIHSVGILFKSESIEAIALRDNSYFKKKLFDPSIFHEKFLDAAHYIVSRNGLQIQGICLPLRQDYAVFIYEDNNFLKRILLELLDYVVQKAEKKSRIDLDFLLKFDLDSEETFYNADSGITNYEKLFSQIVPNSKSFPAISIWRFSFKRNRSESSNLDSVRKNISYYSNKFLKHVNATIVNVHNSDATIFTFDLKIKVEAFNYIKCIQSPTFSVHDEEMESINEVSAMCSSMTQMKNARILYVGTHITSFIQIVQTYLDCWGIKNHSLILDQSEDYSELQLVTTVAKTIRTISRGSFPRIPIILAVDDNIRILRILIYHKLKFTPYNAIVYFSSLTFNEILACMPEILKFHPSKSEFSNVCTTTKPAGPIKLHMIMLEAFASISNINAQTTYETPIDLELGTNYTKVEADQEMMGIMDQGKYLSKGTKSDTSPGLRNLGTINRSSKDITPQINKDHIFKLTPSVEPINEDDTSNIYQNPFHDFNNMPMIDKYLSKMNILIVEDDQVTRSIVRIFLNKIGVQSVETSTVKNAVEAFRNKRFHLILVSLSVF